MRVALWCIYCIWIANLSLRPHFSALESIASPKKKFERDIFHWWIGLSFQSLTCKMRMTYNFSGCMWKWGYTTWCKAMMLTHDDWAKHASKMSTHLFLSLGFYNISLFHGHVKHMSGIFPSEIHIIWEW